MLNFGTVTSVHKREIKIKVCNFKHMSTIKECLIISLKCHHHWLHSERYTPESFDKWEHKSWKCEMSYLNVKLISSYFAYENYLSFSNIHSRLIYEESRLRLTNWVFIRHSEKSIIAIYIALLIRQNSKMKDERAIFLFMLIIESFELMMRKEKNV